MGKNLVLQGVQKFLNKKIKGRIVDFLNLWAKFCNDLEIQG